MGQIWYNEHVLRYQQITTFVFGARLNRKDPLHLSVAWWQVLMQRVLHYLGIA